MAGENAEEKRLAGSEFTVTNKRSTKTTLKIRNYQGVQLADLSGVRVLILSVG